MKGRYERVGNLQVTLAYIGETERLEDIKRAMTEVEVNDLEADFLPCKMTVKKISVMETVFENSHRK